MNIMTKRGSQDNVITYEHYCDTKTDLTNIPADQITLGSVAVVLKDTNNAMCVYMANSNKEWGLIFDGSEEDALPPTPIDIIHICSSGEYDSETKIPTVESPESNIFYLVPNEGATNDLFDEWIYVNNAWEKFGVGKIGEKGEDGITPNLSIGTVTTLAAGSEATATITGTTAEPILSLGIPQGVQGASEDVSELTEKVRQLVTYNQTETNMGGWQHNGINISTGATWYTDHKISTGYLVFGDIGDEPVTIEKPETSYLVIAKYDQGNNYQGYVSPSGATYTFTPELGMKYRIGYCPTNPITPIADADVATVSKQVKVFASSKSFAQKRRAIRRWEGKKFVAFGDSRTSMHNLSYGSTLVKQDWQNKYCVGWQYHVERLLGCKITTAATSGHKAFEIGRTIRNYDFSNYDGAIICGGINDISLTYPVGTVEAIGVEHSENTVTGIWQRTFERVITNYPSLPLFIVAPAIGWVGTDDTVLPPEYAQCKCDAAAVYNLPSLNLYTTAGITTLNRDYYYVDNPETTDNWHVHFNDYGNKLVGEKIAKFIDQW